MEAETIKEQWVWYADNEWSSEIAERDMASRYAPPEQWPIVVNVNEHGGWHMGFFFDRQHPKGIIVSTANDRAKMSDEQLAVRNRLAIAKFEYVPGHRR